MTEFDLGEATLGILPIASIIEAVSQAMQGNSQRSELCLRHTDTEIIMEHTDTAYGRALSPIMMRMWHLSTITNRSLL